MSASRFTCARATGSKLFDGLSAFRLDAGDLLLHLLAEPRELVVAEDVEPRHDVDQVADVADHRVPEHQRLALVVFLETCGDPFPRPRQDGGRGRPTASCSRSSIWLSMSRFTRSVSVGGELRHEVVGVRHRDDPVAQAELALERFLRGIVLDAEQLAEVEPGLGRYCRRSPR